MLSLLGTIFKVGKKIIEKPIVQGGIGIGVAVYGAKKAHEYHKDIKEIDKEMEEYEKKKKERENQNESTKEY